MKVHYRLNILEKIQEAVFDAYARDKTIGHITLNQREWLELTKLIPQGIPNRTTNRYSKGLDHAMVYGVHVTKEDT